MQRLYLVEHMQKGLDMCRRTFSKIRSMKFIRFLENGFDYKNLQNIVSFTIKIMDQSTIENDRKKGKFFWFLFLRSSDSFPTNGFFQKSMLEPPTSHVERRFEKHIGRTLHKPIPKEWLI